MRKIALVLGGGGARGLAHINVLQALDDLGVRPALIVGSSIGAIVGAGYGAGMSAGDIREHVLSIFSSRNEVMARMWRLRPDSLQSWLIGGRRLGEFDAKRVLRAFLPARIPETFEELHIPLRVTATDFHGNSTTVLDSGPLFPALAASAALPVLFRPEMIGGRVHIDGGLTNPVGFDLVEPGYIVLAVDVVGVPAGEKGRLPSRMETAYGASQLMMQSITRLKLRLRQPELFIRPEVDGIRVLDFMHAAAILERTAPTRLEVREKLACLLAEEDAGLRAADPRDG